MNDIAYLQIFNKLYADYRLRFRYFAQTYVRDKDVAEDITSEAFIAYWENRNNIADDANIPAYILTTIKNKCLNHLEHDKVKLTTLNKIQEHASWELNMRVATLEACDPEGLFSGDVQDIVKKTLKSMPQKTYEVFILSRHKNKSNKEIANMLGISVKGVEFHITKALNLLRKNLKDYIFLLLISFFL
jgi:RNA polymerase sigma-70 factor (ECF subfamily)